MVLTDLIMKISGGKAKAKAKKVKRRRKRRGRTSYIQFVAETRPKFVKLHPRMKNTNIIKELAKIWRHHSPAMKKTWEAKARKHNRSKGIRGGGAELSGGKKGDCRDGKAKTDKVVAGYERASNTVESYQRKNLNVETYKRSQCNAPKPKAAKAAAPKKAKAAAPKKAKAAAPAKAKAAAPAKAKAAAPAKAKAAAPAKKSKAKPGKEGNPYNTKTAMENAKRKKMKKGKKAIVYAMVTKVKKRFLVRKSKEGVFTVEEKLGGGGARIGGGGATVCRKKYQRPATVKVPAHKVVRCVGRKKRAKKSKAKKKKKELKGTQLQLLKGTQLSPEKVIELWNKHMYQDKTGTWRHQKKPKK